MLQFLNLWVLLNQVNFGIIVHLVISYKEVSLREEKTLIEFWRRFSIFIERIALSQDFVGVYLTLSVLKLSYFCLDSWRGQELENKVVSFLKS